jgi:Kef-type K+ transport system membrane component KefB
MEISLQALFILFVAAKIGAELCERWHLPAVVGEIAAGVLVGPSVLGWVAPNDLTHILGELGVVFLLFSAGLETRPSAVVDVGKRDIAVAVAGVITPFLGGWFLGALWGQSSLQALFTGTALVATSVGISARVLGGAGAMNAVSSRIIMAAAVIDDILGLLVLSVVSSFGHAGGPHWVPIVATALLAIGFALVVVFAGARLVGSLAPRIHALAVRDSFFLFALVLCLGLSVVAQSIGVAAIIGAFLAGMAIAEAAEGETRLHAQVGGVTEFLVPFFLVGIGMQLKLSVLAAWPTLLFAVVLTLVAVVTKLAGCGLAVRDLGAKRALQVGMGMVPRGEVGIVVAQIGVTLGIVDDNLFAVVLFMAVATTLLAPPFIARLFAAENRLAV